MKQAFRRPTTATALAVFAFLVCGLLPPAPTRAQTIHGTITGQVVDEAGAAVAGATVTVKSPSTGTTRTAQTNEEGLYRISGLPIGVYSVRVETTNFAPAVVQELSVSTAVDSKADFTLRPGGVQETVAVTSAGELLETQQSQVSKTVDETRILELPGRNSLNGLALLNPGVLPNTNARPGSGFAVNGNRTRSNNFTIDGANNNDQSLSIPRQNLPSEALQEFQIITNTFSAEFGRNAGSYVNQITRSGTNEFHGAAHYTWSGNGYNALTTTQERNFRAARAAGSSEYQALRAARAVEVDHTYGATLGGPIKRDHTFFFLSYDANNFRTTAGAQRIALSPQAAANLRANAGLFAPGAVDFILNTYPIANVPADRGTLTVRNPANNAVVTTLPLQTFNRGLTEPLRFGTNFKRFLPKITTRLNEKDQLSFRYLIDSSENPGSPASIPGQEIGSNSKNQSFTINDVYTLTPTVINEFRATYSRREIDFPENLGFSFTVSGTGTFDIGNANFPQFRTDNVYELTDNVSYVTGNHALKFGYNMLLYHLNSFFAPNLRGTVIYPSIGEFLFDQNATIARYAGTGSVDARTYEHSFFVQDDWRVNPDLTLNLGLRYEYVTTPFGFFSNATPDVNNFGPRVGFAYNPKNIADGRFVLRAGFGISYDQVFQNVLLNNSRNFPRGVTIALASINGQRPYLGLPTPPSPDDFVRLGGNPDLLPARLFSPNERVRQPESRQWTVGVQYQISRDFAFKADYIGTQGRNLIREVESNVGFCGALSRQNTPCTATGATLNRERANPALGSVLVSQGQATSIYHSGQFTVERRPSAIRMFEMDFGTIQFNANYTYSSFISTSDDILGGQNNRTLPADPRNQELDRARSGFDQPHRFVASYVFIGPDLFRNNAFANRLLGGWEIAGITTSASGVPYSILTATNPLGILPGQINTVELSQRPGFNPNGAPGTVTTANAQGVPVDPNARYIVYPTGSGFAPTLGANTERTGTTNNTDLALVKNVRAFGENDRLQLRVEVFNVFNHRNFTTIPARTVSASTNLTTFLNLGQTNVAGRTFTFGARYLF
ncbi:MAG TPA: TonB-dependent receptor [Pyrinomonadaceae bacterium]